MTVFGSKNHILCVDSWFTCNTIKPPCSSQLLSLGGRVIWNIINCCDHPQYHWHKGWISNTKRKALNCQCIKSDKSYKCLKAALQLQCLTTAWRLPDDCLKTVLQMPKMFFSSSKKVPNHNFQFQSKKCRIVGQSRDSRRAVIRQSSCSRHAVVRQLSTWHESCIRESSEEEHGGQISGELSKRYDYYLQAKNLSRHYIFAKSVMIWPL